MHVGTSEVDCYKNGVRAQNLQIKQLTLLGEVQEPRAPFTRRHVQVFFLDPPKELHPLPQDVVALQVVGGDRMSCLVDLWGESTNLASESTEAVAQRRELGCRNGPDTY